MCNRYERPSLEEIVVDFDAGVSRAFNAGPETVHPRDPGFVVLERDGRRVVEQMTWGFPVRLKGSASPRPVNNARFDKLTAFWRRWAEAPQQRCLIPCRRFAEAVGETGRMTETWLSPKGERTFAWAGLWQSSAEWGDCYTGVMTDAAPELMEIHDRCPVIPAPSEWKLWLSAPLGDLRRFDRPWPAKHMHVEATDRRWSRRGAGEGSGLDGQRSLFP